MTDLRTPADRHRAMSWAQRLKRGFGIESCEQCGGKVKVIASIEDPAVIGQILGRLASRQLPAGSGSRRREWPAAPLAVCAAQIRGQRRDWWGRGSAPREEGQPDGRGGRDPGLADS